MPSSAVRANTRRWHWSRHYRLTRLSQRYQASHGAAKVQSSPTKSVHRSKTWTHYRSQTHTLRVNVLTKASVFLTGPTESCAQQSRLAPLGAAPTIAVSAVS